jgi:Domain of unknown function (DUF4112)
MLKRSDIMPPSTGRSVDGRDLERVRVLARVLDELVTVPGTRIRVGLDAIVGLIPGVGDVVAGLVGAYALVIANRLGAPPSVLARMVGNVLLDMLVGSVPILGDLFDVAWKANRRNYDLLRAYLAAPGSVGRRSTLLVVVAAAVLLAAVVAAGWLSFIGLRWLLRIGR